MVRSRCIKFSDIVFDELGEIATTAFCLVCLVLFLALVGIVLAIDGLNKARWLGPIVAGALAALALVSLVGCSSAPKLDPRDPLIWRPTTPAVYPLPR